MLLDKYDFISAKDDQTKHLSYITVVTSQLVLLIVIIQIIGTVNDALTLSTKGEDICVLI